jgi:spore coat polysaccharide biosynthesis protein SpsF (cytidylyltransferase family)
MRLTVDYPDDFELISKIFDHFSTVPDFKSEKVIELLEVNHPEWLDINNDAQYLYEKHIERSAPVRFKSIQA